MIRKLHGATLTFKPAYYLFKPGMHRRLKVVSVPPPLLFTYFPIGAAEPLTHVSKCQENEK